MLIEKLSRTVELGNALLAVPGAPGDAVAGKDEPIWEAVTYFLARERINIRPRRING